MRIGNIGTKKKPPKEKQIADGINSGMAQIMISKLWGKKIRKKDFITTLSYRRLGDKLPLPYCYDGIHKYNPPFTNLT